MAIYQSELVECPECGGDWFVMEESVQIHVKAPDRITPEERAKPLPAFNKMLVYRCSHCKTVLPK